MKTIPLFLRAAFVALILSSTAQAATLHVDASKPDDSGNGSTWATAFKNIQEWFVDWECADPKKGIFWHELDVVGGRYGNGVAPALPLPADLLFSAVPGALPALTALPAGVWMEEAFPWKLPVVYGAANKLSLPKGPAPKKIAIKGEIPVYDYTLADAKAGHQNPSGATLAFTAKTGLFSGKFKLYNDGYDAKDALKHTTVSVPYKGVMVPVNGVLTGYGTGAATINKAKVGMPVYLWAE